jgi:hypothetical protein
MTPTWLLNVAEGTTHDKFLAKNPLYARRGHQPGADAPRWGMRHRGDVRRPKFITVDASTTCTVARWWRWRGWILTFPLCDHCQDSYGL